MKGVKIMARIIENLDGKRKMVKLSTDDVISIVREYQQVTGGCKSFSEIRSKLSDRIFFIPEEI